MNSGSDQVTVLDKKESPFDEKVKYIQGDLQKARCVMACAGQEFGYSFSGKKNESFITQMNTLIIM